MKSQPGIVRAAVSLAAFTLTLAVSAQEAAVILAGNGGKTEFRTPFSTNSDWQAASL